MIINKKKGENMLTDLVSMLTRSLSSMPAVQTKPVQVETKENSNPFAGGSSSMFFNSSRGSSLNYAKNRPIEGGYFAGYYNDKPNIVGRRLFIEV